MYKADIDGKAGGESAEFRSLIDNVRACTICARHLPSGPRPVIQIHPESRVLIAGQAPGRKVHESAVPFDDASGKRLREKLLAHLPRLEITLVIGQYAQAYHLDDGKSSVTEIVKSWRKHWPDLVPLPHPSPRNNIWLSRNPWFGEELLPSLRQRVRAVISK